MKQEYIITPQELENYGLNLSDYALDTILINPIINVAFNMCITRVLFFNDNFKFEKDIEKALDDEPLLVAPFKKLQYQTIYNLVFLGDVDPMNVLVDNIICCDLRWGKINGYQKNIYLR